MTDLEVKDGDVVRYHPIMTSADFVVVRIDGDPWALGDGSRICRAIAVGDGKVHRPWLAALTKDEGISIAPMKAQSRRRR